MIRTKKAKQVREKLEDAQTALNVAIENNREMGSGETVQFKIDCNQGELDFARSCLETSEALLTKPFDEYSCSQTGRYSSKRAESHSQALKLVARLEQSLESSIKRLTSLKELSYMDEEPLRVELGLEQLRYENVMMEEALKIETKEKKKSARLKADKELAAIPVFIFSKETTYGRKFLIEDLLSKMKKRKGLIAFVNQDGYGGVPTKEFLYILRLHKNCVAEINFVSKDETERVNVSIYHDGGHSPVLFHYESNR